MITVGKHLPFEFCEECRTFNPSVCADKQSAFGEHITNVFVTCKNEVMCDMLVKELTRHGKDLV